MYPRPAGQVLRSPWQLLGPCQHQPAPIESLYRHLQCFATVGNGNASALGFNDLTGDMARLL